MITKSIKIPISADELERLLDGETFEWNFDGIEVYLFNEDSDAF